MTGDNQTRKPTEMMALDDFDELTDEASGFLQVDFGYQATPTKIGGRFNTACVREFVRKDLRIILVVGDADSSHFCSVLFDRGIDAKVDSTQDRYGDLVRLLAKRRPDFDPPSLRDLPTRNSQIEAIRNYALLLRDFARDEIDGDLSAFSDRMLFSTTCR